jgi:hypothetical protein
LTSVTAPGSARTSVRPLPQTSRQWAEATSVLRSRSAACGPEPITNRAAGSFTSCCLPRGERTRRASWPVGETSGVGGAAVIQKFPRPETIALKWPIPCASDQVKEQPCGAEAWCRARNPRQMAKCRGSFAPHAADARRPEGASCSRQSGEPPRPPAAESFPKKVLHNFAGFVDYPKAT